jgi:hypothetical protein
MPVSVKLNPFKVLEGGNRILTIEAENEPSGPKNDHMFDDINEARDEFDRAVSKYYLQKSVESDPSLLPLLDEGQPGSEELAQNLLVIPSRQPRHVLVKLNILENELATDMDLAAPVDGKHLRMFAALKADMIALLAQ